MADAANGGTEDVVVKEEGVLKEDELALEGVVERSEGGVAEKIDAVEESVEEGGVGESLNSPDSKGSVSAVKGKEVTVESEAFETAPILVEDGKGEEILAVVVEKELEEQPEVPPEIVEQQEIPESTGNPAAISVSESSVPSTSWKSCCGLFDVLRHS